MYVCAIHLFSWPVQLIWKTSSTSLSPTSPPLRGCQAQNLMCQMLIEARKHFHLFPLVFFFSPVDTYWNIANFSLWFFSRLDQHVIKKERKRKQQQKQQRQKVNGALSRFPGKTSKENGEKRRWTATLKMLKTLLQLIYIHTSAALEYVCSKAAIMCKSVQICANCAHCCTL